jgi:hypothetical protein
MHQLFEADETDAILLIDADNAFNSLNRSAALWNIRFVCPKVATLAISCYRTPSRLFVVGGAEIASREGTTQGDPLAMPLYVLAITPLIRELQGPIQQAWYADDAQAAGRLMALRSWWDMIVSKGPAYGYFANPSKTILVVKSTLFTEAARVFEGTGVTLREGTRDLGAAIGCSTFAQKYVTEKVSE